MRVALLSSSVLIAFLPTLPLVAQTAEFSLADLAGHYTAVERELRDAPLPKDPTIAVRRLAAIDLLHEYRVRGNFGDDLSDSGLRNALFIDDAGRRCAVAFLLDRTGRSDLTNTIAEQYNDAWIVELANDSELRSWLHTNGLTLAEAARIQGPSGGNPRGNPPPPPPTPGIPWLSPSPSEPDAPPEPSAPFWRAPAAATTPSAVPPASNQPTESPARRTPGMPITALPAPAWSPWWDWNRDRFEPPTIAPEDDTANTRVRAISREQVVTVLRTLAGHAQADVRAAAMQALGRMLALNANDAEGLEQSVREVRLRTLATAAYTPDLKELHRFAKTTLPALHGEAALVALAACACSTNSSFGGMIEQHLIDAFLATSPDTVAAAALAAAKDSRPRLRELARSIVRDDGAEWRRGLLAATLAPGASTDDVAALTIALGARSPAVRRAAAIALGHSRAEFALPALLTAYELEHEQGVKGTLLLAVGDHGGGAAVPFLRKELVDGPRALRVLTAIGLGMAAHGHDKDDETAHLIAAMRADHNRDHTGGYLLALGLTGDVRALPTLHAELHGAPTSVERGAAASAIGLLRDPASIPQLTLAAGQDSCPWVRCQCVRALGRIGDEATDTLRDLLQRDANIDVQAAAAAALGDVASSRAAAGLLAAARDPDSPPAVLVGVALGLGRHFRTTEPQLPTARAAMDPQAMPALIAWVAGQDL